MSQDASFSPSPPRAPSIDEPPHGTSMGSPEVTVRGRAEPRVAVELWDWLTPVADTVADDEGHWFVTVNVVDAGEHMYFARAVPEVGTPSERSNVVLVQVNVADETALPNAPTTRARARRTNVSSVLHRMRRRRQIETEESEDEIRHRGAWERLLDTQVAPSPPEPDRPAERDEQMDDGLDQPEPADSPLPVATARWYEPASLADGEIDAAIEIDVTGIELVRPAIEVAIETVQRFSPACEPIPVEEPFARPLPIWVEMAPVRRVSVPSRVWMTRVTRESRPMRAPIEPSTTTRPDNPESEKVPEDRWPRGAGRASYPPEPA